MNSSKETIALVTGANRGIGLEIARQLVHRGATVTLTSRNADAGKAALEKLGATELKVQFHTLDVTEKASIVALRQFVEKTYGRLDVLINNAGIISNDDGSILQVKLEAVRATLETNTLAPLHLAQTFVPLLKHSRQGRIVNMSSGMGQLSEMDGGYAAYRISKAALNAVTGILAAELRGSVAVNSMCPGWVRTDMGGANAERDVSQGADTAVWLALDAPQDLTGKFLRDRKVIPW
jgi:NAD(P)-dependent dehydrogenase (short-subunit alcohol dehydrogenase family)